MNVEEKLSQEVGARLNEARTLLGKYQADIAKEYADYSQLSFNQSVISSYEKGKLRPSFIYLKFLAEKYNINANYVLTGHGNMFINAKPVDGVALVNHSVLESLESNLSWIAEQIKSMKS